MIIYDKNFNFLGMSSNVLSLLGYGDLSTFLETNEDIADLFIKKPGFIHKFNNFSWVNYVLNGATPNKVVSIKLQNGNELQATVKIIEIQLKDDGKLYTVELQNTVVIPYFEPTNVQHETKENIFEAFSNNTSVEKAEKSVHSNSTNDNDSFIKAPTSNADVFSINNDLNLTNNSTTNDVKLDKFENINESSFSLDFGSQTVNLNTDSDFTQKESKDSADDFTISFGNSDSVFLSNSNIEDIVNKNEIKVEAIVDGLVQDYGFEKEKVKGYFNDYSSFASEEFLKLDRHLEHEDNELLNAEIVKLIGISNILKLEDVVKKLTELKLASSFDKKKKIISDIKTNINDLANKLKG